MSHRASQSTPVDATADRILASIAIDPKDGSRSVIPAPVFAKWHGRLRTTLRGRRVVFEHLLVMHARLRKAGLARAAHQLRALAEIGLRQAKPLAASLTRIARAMNSKYSARSHDRPLSRVLADLTPRRVAGVGLRR